MLAVLPWIPRFIVKEVSTIMDKVRSAVLDAGLTDLHLNLLLLPRRQHEVFMWPIELTLLQ